MTGNNTMTQCFNMEYSFLQHLVMFHVESFGAKSIMGGLTVSEVKVGYKRDDRKDITYMKLNLCLT